MNKDYFVRLFDYNFWAQRKVWACVEHLDEARYRQDLAYSVGSIHDQCFHMMEVEHWWFHFLREGVLDFLEPAHYPDRASIRAYWDTLEAYIRDYLETLTPAELSRQVKPGFWAEFDIPTQPIQVWEGLIQVANHGVDHRAQTLAGLHRLGAPTVEQDYVGYHFEQHVVSGLRGG